jgi:transposase
MSKHISTAKINIKALFNYLQVIITDQYVDINKKEVKIKARFSNRNIPVCPKCKAKVRSVHSYYERTVRDMNILDCKTYVSYIHRKIRCPNCGIVVAESKFVDRRSRISKRLEMYIMGLSKYITVKEIAEHLELDWKTVKEIHKRHLKERFSKEDIGYPRIIALDEVSVKKGHNYLTVIIDWESGKVLWVGEGRKYETLKEFFEALTEEQRDKIEAVAMDMWDPYIKAVKEYCPNGAIVFDQFHILSAYSRVIDKVRNTEYRKATKKMKGVIKGSKYLLLKNKENLENEERGKLRRLLNLNKTLNIVYILKDYLKRLWKYKYRRCAEKFLEHWCRLAEESGIKALKTFTKMLKRYAYGILNHCKYGIHTSRMEGINNKIKVIKRKAYGFRDIEYFSLIIKSTFADSN